MMFQHIFSFRKTVSNTPTNTARTELHSMITLHHANTRGSRAHSSGLHALVSLTLLSSTCHVSFLAAPDTVHLHQFLFLPTSPTFSTISQTHTRLLVHDEYLPCDVPRQSGGSTQIPSLTKTATVTRCHKQFLTTTFLLSSEITPINVATKLQDCCHKLEKLSNNLSGSKSATCRIILVRNCQW